MYIIFINHKLALMKLVFISLLIVCTAITSCNSPKDKITIKDEKGNKATIDVSSINEAAKKMEENNNETERLKKLAPLSLDQVKALIPNELLGMPRSSFSANSSMGVKRWQRNLQRRWREKN
jgi:hypothetical protein